MIISYCSLIAFTHQDLLLADFRNSHGVGGRTDILHFLGREQVQANQMDLKPSQDICVFIWDMERLVYMNKNANAFTLYKRILVHFQTLI